MPKRDPAYMESQRTLIARATFECMLEKGIYETSIRDICVRAGVSNGAFYCHFKTREDAVIAACTLDQEEIRQSAVESWADFVNWVRSIVRFIDEDRWRKRYRLSYQLMAELSQKREARPDVVNLYGSAGAGFAKIFDELHARGEIDPPLELATTQSLCVRLVVGTVQMMMLNPALDRGEVARELVDGLAILMRPTSVMRGLVAPA